MGDEDKSCHVVEIRRSISVQCHLRQDADLHGVPLSLVLVFVSQTHASHGYSTILTAR